MKKVAVIIFCLLLGSVFLYAKAEDNSAVPNKVCVVISQKFEGHGSHCMPSFDSSQVYYNQIDSAHKLIVIKSAISINDNHYIPDVECKYDATTGNFKFYKKDGEEITKIIVKSHVNGMESNASVEFDFDLKLGSQMNRKGASARCDKEWYDFILGKHSNSYTINTKLVCDAPIPITVTNKDNVKKLNLDKGEFQFDENESVQLELGGYYEKGQTRIRYKVNGSDDWHIIYTDKKITPNKEIKLWYHNIVGPFGTDEYKTNIGKFITIRVEKQLQDGSWSYSGDVECRFYSTGPSFDVVDVRRSSCDETPLSIKIYTEEIEKFRLFFGDEVEDRGKIQWNLTLAEEKEELGNAAPFTLKDCENKGNNTFEIKAKRKRNDNSADDLATFLQENSDIHWGVLQLKVIEREGSDQEKKDDENLRQLIAVNDTFELSPKLKPVDISIKDYDYTDPINAPYAYLNIEDVYSRLKYRVYACDSNGNSLNNNDKTLTEFYLSKDENGKELDLATLRSEFNDSYKNKNPDYSLDITKGDYRKTYFKKWYNAKGTIVRSTTIIKEPDDEPTDSDWDIVSHETISSKDFILRLTQQEKEKDNNGKDVWNTYTYLCKFRVNTTTTNNNPESISYLKFKGVVAEHIEGAWSYNGHNYMLNYNTSPNPVLELIHEYPYFDNKQPSTTPITNPGVGNILHYMAKGNGYYLVEMLSGGMGLSLLIDMSTFHEVIGFQSINASVFEGYDSIYVVNKNFIVCKDGGNVKVWHNGNLYSTYAIPSIFSFKEDENGTGFTYWVGSQQYHTLYNESGWKNMFEYRALMIGYNENNFEKEWITFFSNRKSEWDKFYLNKLEQNSYKVPIPIPQNSNTNIYSGYLKVVDADNCNSNIVKYNYEYNDLSFATTIDEYPTQCQKNGKVEITDIKGSLAPYKHNDSTISNGYVIEDLGYGSNLVTFTDVNGNAITRNIDIQPNIGEHINHQICSEAGGTYKITDNNNNNNTNLTYILKNDNNTYYPTLNNEITVAIGNYKLYYKCGNGNNEIELKDVLIEDKSFSVDVVENSIVDATQIGGNGSVQLKANNFDKNWSVNNKTFYAEAASIELPAKNVPYSNMIATNSKGCKDTLNAFSIKQPSINYIESDDKGTDDKKYAATISYNANDYTATINMECGMGGSMTELTLYLLNKKDDKIADNNIVKDTQNKDVISTTTATGTQKLSSTFNYSTNSTYYIYAKYKAGNATTYSTICLTENGISPLTLDGCKAESSASNKYRCYGSLATINLYGNCTFEIEGNPVSESYETDETDVVVTLSKEESRVFDKFTIAQSVTREDDIQIEEISQPVIDLWVKDVTCFGASDGVIKIESADNIKTSESELLLSLKNDIKPEAKILDNLRASDEYIVIVKDGECKYERNADVSGPSSPLKISVIETVDPTCTNDNGAIIVESKGGWGEYIFAIDKKPIIPNTYAKFCEDKTYISSDSDDKTHLFESLPYGKHTAYVSDNKGCTESVSDELEEYINPHVTSAIFDSVTCYGWNDGVIDTIKFETDCKVDGEPLELFCTKETGVPSNTANWIEYSPSIKNLTAGGYNIWLKDTNQCVSDEPFHIKVEQPDSLILSINDENNIIREYGKPGGAVEVNVSGGNKGTFNIFLDSKEDTLAQVIWGNHAFNDIFTPGTHKLYVTDHKECIDSATTKQMRQPDSPLSIEATPHDALCNGSFGSITVRGSGGWNGYQYSCSSKSNLYGANQNEYTFHDIKGGYYEVSVTDAEGVTATQKVYVNTPPKLMAVPLLRASSCKNDGLISANITGGTMPYLVKPDSSSVTPFYFEPYITNSNLTIIPKQLAAGDYSIVVVDSNNCEILMSATIADSSVKATVKPVYPTAHEFANGRLEAVVQQGPAPYTYQWKNHNTGETCTNAVWDKVGAGVYSLDVTDANNCSVSVPITYLATNGDLPLIIDTIIGETAVGACNGMARFTSDTTGFKSITLHGNSGAEKDVTSLVNNKLQFELTGLAPDSYLLECVLADTTVRYAKFTIARYEPMHLIVSNIVDVSKQDAANGSAKLRIDGGRAPFIVQMLRGDDFLADTVLNDRNLPMSGLMAANYTVSVVDESDNRINTQFIIRKPEKPLRLQAQSVENPSCNGYTNGRIILKATGGWGDYEYAAAEGEFGRATAYDGRGAAVHTFVAIDSKGITDTLKVELVEPLPLTARVVQVDSVSCFGLTDGSVTFDIAGGTAPYTVHYDDFFDKKSNFVGSLNAGTHTFNITDSNFCRAVEGSLAVDIPQPGVLQVASDSVVHTTCNTDNGRIFITIAGGTAPYASSWREDGLIKERFANLTAIDSLQGYSLYEVEVADAKGCKTGKSYRINPSSGPKIERVRTLPVLCHGDSTGTAIIDSADIVPATPYSPFRIEWPHGENAMSVGNLPAGRNVVFVIDSNNCKSGTGFNVDAPSPVEIRKIGSRDASCYGYADGRISTLTLGGVGGYRYLWSNGDTLPDIDSIAKGAYTIVVADRNNCRDSAVFAIGQPDSLHVEIGEENVLMCPDNTYEFIPTDGFKTYRWILNDSTLSDKRNLIASEQGEYHLVATYGANCISRDTVTITIGDDLLEADFYMASDASKDNTIALVELSNMKTDSIRWDFSATDFDVMDSSLYELQLKPNTIGLHNITLWAYSSGCVSYITKQVEISELPDTTDNIQLGYDPLIKSVTVKPNPTNGQFGVDVQLRESHEAEMTISSVSHGTQIEQRKLAGDAEYSESFDLSNVGDGVYILRITAGNEQRVTKVLITK